MSPLVRLVLASFLLLPGFSVLPARADAPSQLGQSEWQTPNAQPSAPPQQQAPQQFPQQVANPMQQGSMGFPGQNQQQPFPQGGQPSFQQGPPGDPLYYGQATQNQQLQPQWAPSQPGSQSQLGQSDWQTPNQDPQLGQSDWQTPNQPPPAEQTPPPNASPRPGTGAGTGLKSLLAGRHDPQQLKNAVGNMQKALGVGAGIGVPLAGAYMLTKMMQKGYYARPQYYPAPYGYYPPPPYYAAPIIPSPTLAPPGPAPANLPLRWGN